jgi:hypothetical protein
MRKIAIHGTGRIRRAAFKPIIEDGSLERAACPRRWMSPEGYARCVVATLAKMRQRRASS